MAISNVNIAMGASSYGAYQQKLSAATKAELERLGIPYNPDITENEGRALIAQFKSKQAHNQQAGNNFNKNHQQEMSDLYKRACELAQKIGIQVKDQIDFKSLLSLIEQALESKINANQNNVNLLKQLQGYSQELASIQAESMGASYDTTNKALEKSLEMLSLYNKNFLNN